MRTTAWTVALLAIMIFILATDTAHCQTPAEPVATAATAPPAGDEGDTEAAERKSPLELLMAGGPVGLLILLLSVAAVALCVEHLVTIRAKVLMPPGLGEEVHGMLASGQLAPAVQRCRAEPSMLSFVLEAGMGEAEGGWPAVEKAVEDAAAEQSARLFRKIEYLSVIGNIAPMMGLLGTVLGMISAFQELSASQGAPRAADLAEGIYLALITTVLGLIVAIPCLAAFAVFRNRVDYLMAESTYVVQHVFSPLKRHLQRGTPAAPQPRAGDSPKQPPTPPAPPSSGGS